MAGVGVLDVLTGYELSVSLFVSKWSPGLAVEGTVSHTFVWFASVFRASLSHPVILYWNTAIRSAKFTAFCLAASP